MRRGSLETGGGRPPARDVRRARSAAAWTTVALAFATAVAGCGERGGPAAEVPVGTEVGQAPPPLTGYGADGRAFELAPRGEGTAVIFFRGYHCGLCRERLRELQANLGEYDRAGVSVVAATPDSRENAGRAAQDLGLGFPVVSVDSAVFASWGLMAGEGGLPLPGSYLLDRRGVVIFRHVGRSAADRTHDVEVLAALQDARGR
jgi:peroxiredoxin